MEEIFENPYFYEKAKKHFMIIQTKEHSKTKKRIFNLCLHPILCIPKKTNKTRQSKRINELNVEWLIFSIQRFHGNIYRSYIFDLIPLCYRAASRILWALARVSFNRVYFFFFWPFEKKSILCQFFKWIFVVCVSTFCLKRTH